MTSIKDVAERAGVSVATVSRVLANKPNVRPEMREHVLKIVEELNYRRNRVASSLRTRTTNIIGLMVSDIRNPFFTDIARAIEDFAQSREMSVFLCNTDENPEKEQFYLNTLLDENVAGIILSPTGADAKAYDAVLKYDTPIVTIDRRIHSLDVDSVMSDNIHSSVLLTNHLIERGYQNIAAIIGLSQITTGQERMQGFRQALSTANMPLNQDRAVFVRPTEQSGEAVVYQWLQENNPPDAILTGNSRLTIGAMNAIHKAGLSIPDDIALAGFDETSWMPHIGPGITVIQQPTYDMGTSAAELLLQRIEDSERPTREVILKGQLVIRHSTRARSS